MAASLYFKVLSADGRCHFGGSGSWPLPHDGKPGNWRSVRGDLVPCTRGLHLCEPGDVLGWIGPSLWIAEGAGESIRDASKTVFRRARLISRVEAWNDVTLRLFAADCAEHVLPIFAAVSPEDGRPWQAIEAARDFAHGRISADELAAARDAALSAARDAALSAARDAALSAAWDAAGAAAVDAAGDAAGDAAWAAAKDAAKDAAKAAAKAAAWAAAKAAAWAAAKDAAGDAAWAAERRWQTERLFSLVGIAPPAATTA